MLSSSLRHQRGLNNPPPRSEHPQTLWHEPISHKKQSQENIRAVFHSHLLNHPTEVDSYHLYFIQGGNEAPKGDLTCQITT